MKNVIDNLTIAQARAIARMFGGAAHQCQPSPVETEERPVLVTTAYRGVFFGYATATGGTTISLNRARNCLYWSHDVKGFLGLCTTGPTASCRTGPPADIELRDITCVAEVQPGAVKAWEAAPWAS